eukprot:CAMPEP_0174884866 /NCGR_PEP_ID=MMETSP0167-20121228/277_1 /TAXON_ID=38298 /ORGANISM="Rhodella maculata, Strain CCMP736" /LENGTH=89 /DNA_ID=CAMNT_0016120339 /DNA_START=54 /DNA_END=320 /DNA_ORIENTATION=-
MQSKAKKEAPHTLMPLSPPPATNAPSPLAARPLRLAPRPPATAGPARHRHEETHACSQKKTSPAWSAPEQNTTRPRGAQRAEEARGITW